MGLPEVRQEICRIEDTLGDLSEVQVLFSQIFNQVLNATEKIRREIELMSGERTSPLDTFLRPAHVDEFSHSIASWTNRSVARVIHEGFADIDTLRQRVADRRDVLFVVGAGKNVFGSFHEKTGAVGEWVFDLNHFVFSIKNPFGVPPTQFKRRSKDRVLLLAEDGPLRINGWAEIGRQSFIDFMFPTHYVDTIGRGGDIFVGNVYLQSFKVDYFLALEMRLA